MHCLRFMYVWSKTHVRIFSDLSHKYGEFVLESLVLTLLKHGQLKPVERDIVRMNPITSNVLSKYIDQLAQFLP